jgi:benzoyl-CoA reductase/2-hydroxyglutaryl-CoA dehydratase subunit BcrC/BadD/HgdB
MEKSGLGEMIEHNRTAILMQKFEDVKLPSELVSPRVAVVGGMTEPESIARILEVIPNEIEPTIVLDILSFGFKTIFTLPPEGDDSYEAMAKSILSSPGEPTQEGLSKRVNYIVNLITNLSIDGLIICEQSFCDPDEFEAPSIEKAITKLDLPVVRLPMDSELSDLSRLGVRIQSFLETMQFE